MHELRVVSMVVEADRALLEQRLMRRAELGEVAPRAPRWSLHLRFRLGREQRVAASVASAAGVGL